MADTILKSYHSRHLHSYSQYYNSTLLSVSLKLLVHLLQRSRLDYIISDISMEVEGGSKIQNVKIIRPYQTVTKLQSLIFVHPVGRDHDIDLKFDMRCYITSF